MRLNWFLKPRPRGRASKGRRWLHRLGPTWAASPLRRLAQTASLLLFLWLLFYVSWPYTARPAPPEQRQSAAEDGRTEPIESAPASPPARWPGWLPIEVDPESGEVSVVAEQPSASRPGVGTIVRIDDAGAGGTVVAAPFRVSESGEEGVRLRPVTKLEGQQLDQLLASLGPWNLIEFSPAPPPPGPEAPPGQETAERSWPSHYADDLAAKQFVPAETFLALDPLVSISTALAAKTWIWSLAFAGAILAVCLFVPRGFCGYVCPLGTLIDLVDWALLRRVTWFRPAAVGWWSRLKYYLLAAVLAASLAGVLVSGFVAAIPVVTRGLVFLLLPLQTGLERGWHQVPPITAGHLLSLALFFLVLGLGLLRPRFWCRYVCPTGAVFSLVNFAALSRRRVAARCIGCNKCVEVCPFDAIHTDFSTRPHDCTFCQTCGGVCPVEAIEFRTRWELRPSDDEPLETPAPLPAANRRRFLAASGGVAAGLLGGVAVGAATRAFGGQTDGDAYVPVRPPGSVPEPQFLEMCIRCGACYQACPNDVLQPMTLSGRLESLWTPQVVADWSGCEPSCNNCGHVCPTGAIRPLPLEEKRVARMGLAVVNEKTCLPHALLEACQLCVDECITAGYQAIEFQMVGTEQDEQGNPRPDTGFKAPRVLPDRCVGCGLCQTRCRAINVVQKGLLDQSAVRVEAGQGREDRLMRGSYTALREKERQRRDQQRQQLQNRSGPDSYLIEGLK